VRVSGTPLAPQTNGMATVLSVERFEASKRSRGLAFKCAVKCACTRRGARMLGARDVRERERKANSRDRPFRRSRRRE